MKLILKELDLNYENVSFSKIKKNFIIEGSFTKIIYSDTFVSINGIYMEIPLIFINFPSYLTFSPKRSVNKNLKNLFERSIEEDQFAVSKEGNFASTSFPQNSFLPTLISKESLNFSKNKFCGNDVEAKLRKSSKLCSEKSLNVSSKNVKYLYFFPYTPYNLFIIKKIAEIEEKIINYYKNFYKINKNTVFNLFHLLNFGKIKVYKEEYYTSSCFNENANFSTLHFPSQATKNQSSSKLISDESIHFSTLHSEKLIFGSGNASGKNKFCENEVETKLRDSSEISLEEDPFSVACEGKSIIILKISGIWETKTEIGLTYKFIEMKN